MTEDEIRSLFSSLGEIVSVKLTRDKSQVKFTFLNSDVNASRVLADFYSPSASVRADSNRHYACENLTENGQTDRAKCLGMDTSVLLRKWKRHDRSPKVKK
uniref:RRM domain-containing protein n=1 Tax=Glossina palpalis gambiensis TaxID=67801 RepID=A0A1B0BUV4_9MUSC